MGWVPPTAIVNAMFMTTFEMDMLILWMVLFAAPTLPIPILLLRRSSPALSEGLVSDWLKKKEIPPKAKRNDSFSLVKWALTSNVGWVAAKVPASNAAMLVYE